MSSSLEIVDALTEAAEDTPDQHLQKVRIVDMSAQFFPNNVINHYFYWAVHLHYASYILHFHFPKESSPAESVLSCPDLVMVEANTFDDFQDAMTTSQYAQVGLLIFTIRKTNAEKYVMCDLQCLDCR